jgi:hypothetical protein
MFDLLEPYIGYLIVLYLELHMTLMSIFTIYHIFYQSWHISSPISLPSYHVSFNFYEVCNDQFLALYTQWFTIGIFLIGTSESSIPKMISDRELMRATMILYVCTQLKENTLITHILGNFVLENYLTSLILHLWAILVALYNNMEW